MGKAAKTILGHKLIFVARILSQLNQHFALFNTRLIVEMQHSDRRPTFRGLWSDHSAIQREMIVPRMTAGVKQECRFARFGVGSGDIRAFVVIAQRATVSQIIRIG